MTNLYDEIWMRQRMIDHRGPDVFDGTTDTHTRKQRLREAIKELGLEPIIIGAVNRKPLDWRQAFENYYGEPL